MNGLEKYLARKRLTRVEFGELIGVSGQTVGRWINGQRYPRPRELLRIIEVTKGKVTANHFLRSLANAA